MFEGKRNNSSIKNRRTINVRKNRDAADIGSEKMLAEETVVEL